MDADPKNYELAYLLASSLSEEEALTWTNKLTTLIEESKGALRHLESPKKRPLAYLVKKQKTAYFGWTTFSMLPGSIDSFEKKLRGQEHLLRHLVSEEEKREFRPTFVRPPLFASPTPTAPIPQQSMSRAPEKSEEKLDLEALDRKLEEILGK